ncbi:uncharacterized protein LOC124807837 isoform X5 [Hydra vulgaris]|uniref:uncharacterized protein LOC124807837 isoform X5 n=1 Tax=Hydra vulgaris TaxID=6087 RepID=UPI0032EA4E07
MDKLKKLEDSVENLKKVEHSMEKLENSIASSTVPSASISSAVPSAIETVLTAVPPATISAGPSATLIKLNFFKKKSISSLLTKY